MAFMRPAGYSDSDDSDAGFYDKPVARSSTENQIKPLETQYQELVVKGVVSNVSEFLNTQLNGNINYRFESGWTPLIYACYLASELTVTYLLEKGADPDLDADLLTPLMATCGNYMPRESVICNIVDRFLDRNCKLDIGDRFGETALMKAINSGLEPVVYRLIEAGANIEMRDRKGWTAIFWAAHGTKTAILEMLIQKGARLTEVDIVNRTPLEVAREKGTKEIIALIRKHLGEDEDDEEDEDTEFYALKGNPSWHDYYPESKEDVKITYKSEIADLLYGMNCERVARYILASGMDLRTFLLLKEEDMLKIGVYMPYERKRLINGLHNFHKRKWKLSAVSGLYARRKNNYNVVDCLTSLGTHLQQVYIMEATLQYMTRDEKILQDLTKTTPPDATLYEIKKCTKKLLNNINYIRNEMKVMTRHLTQMNENNIRPLDIGNMKKKNTFSYVLAGHLTRSILLVTIGYVGYHASKAIVDALKK